MRNFQLMMTNVDVVPLLNAVMRNAHLWNQHKLRTTHENTPHSAVSDIWLRFNDLSLYENQEAKVLDEHESINYPAFAVLPQARPLIFGLMNAVQGERLGRCLITRLAPGDRITKHADSGSHAAYFDRYHVVLQGHPGCVFNCGNETVQMRTGEVWWFQNQIEHEVINDSAADRIHLIVDIRTLR